MLAKFYIYKCELNNATGQRCKKGHSENELRSFCLQYSEFRMLMLMPIR